MTMDTTLLFPLLTTAALPPMGPLLLAVLGLISWAIDRRKTAALLLFTSVAMLWALSTHGLAVLLAQKALPQHVVAQPEALQTQGVQAIVVLGGGIAPQSPEYGEPQLNAYSEARLRYGAWLARKTAIPMAYSGGVGWAAANGTATEAATAQKSLQLTGTQTFKWTESTSRDTRQNARLSAQLLQKDGVKKIALVTHAWHMPRAVRMFEAAGFDVTPAPMGYVLPEEHAWIEWLPTALGLRASRDVLREMLALQVQGY
jgi:uncharacterized SAM-binding protein YcdF (DUF218 family)